ncbi:MAG: signal peptidase II [Acidobacteria bacterium]|nr:signal peptidase II [Acidobacteriota bacterium]
MNRYHFLFFSAVVFLADQITKFFLKKNLPFGDEREIFPFFTIVHWQNRGGLWGFMGNASEVVSFILFIILPFAGVGFLIYLFLHSKSKTDLFLISLMLGGAFGNILDRILSGAVTDFLYFHLPDRSWSWPAFNIADACLSTSLTIFIFKILFERKEENAPDTF